MRKPSNFWTTIQFLNIRLWNAIKLIFFFKSKALRKRPLRMQVFLDGSLNGCVKRTFWETCRIPICKFGLVNNRYCKLSHNFSQLTLILTVVFDWFTEYKNIKYKILKTPEEPLTTFIKNWFHSKEYLFLYTCTGQDLKT